MSNGGVDETEMVPATVNLAQSRAVYIQQYIIISSCSVGLLILRRSPVRCFRYICVYIELYRFILLYFSLSNEWDPSRSSSTIEPVTRVS